MKPNEKTKKEENLNEKNSKYNVQKNIETK